MSEDVIDRARQIFERIDDAVKCLDEIKEIIERISDSMDKPLSIAVYEKVPHKTPKQVLEGDND